MTITCMIIILFMLVPTATRTGVAQWNAPQLDSFFYHNATGSGIRDFGPTFIGGLEIAAGNGGFVEHTAQAPARLGMSLLAFDTSTQIQTQLPSHQYNIASIEITFTMQSGTFDTLRYDATADSRQDVFAEILTGNIDNSRPMELYGVGFRNSYDEFDFTGGGASTRFRESTNPYSASDGGYVAYPIVTTGSADVDVSNSITGGFSATAPNGHTSPFDPVPWAIGIANLQQDAPIPDNTTFTFSVDLELPGVRTYIQNALSEGGLGFFVSSLHLASQPGFGAFPYPQWFLRESAGGIFWNASDTANRLHDGRRTRM